MLRSKRRRQFLKIALGAAFAGLGKAGVAQSIFASRKDKASYHELRGITRIGTWLEFGTLSIPVGIDVVHSSGFQNEGAGGARYRLDENQSEAPTTPFRRRSANGRWFRIDEDIIGYTMAGAKGEGIGGVRDDGTVVPDGGADDTEAIQALYDYLASIGGGTALVEARQFNVRSLHIRCGNIHTVGLGRASHVHVTARAGRPNVFNVIGGKEDPADSNDPLTNQSFDPRWQNVSFENIRISGGAQWGLSPHDFNGVLSGNGIRTRWVDDLRVVNCWFDHLSDSGPSIRDGDRPLIQGNELAHLAQGVDVFYRCHDGQIIGNTLRDVKVFAGINVEGRVGAGFGHPARTIVSDNLVVGVTTSGIDIIEAFESRVTENTVKGVSGAHPGFPGYAFGVQAFGSPKTMIVDNDVQDVRGTQEMGGARHNAGIGICVGANSSDSMVLGNFVRRCSLAACSVRDSGGTAPTNNVLVVRNSFDTEILLEGNVSLRPTGPSSPL